MYDNTYHSNINQCPINTVSRRTPVWLGRNVIMLPSFCPKPRLRIGRMDVGNKVFYGSNLHPSLTIPSFLGRLLRAWNLLMCFGSFGVHMYFMYHIIVFQRFLGALQKYHAVMSGYVKLQSMYRETFPDWRRWMYVCMILPRGLDF
jgi:hypothetical protein